MTTKKITSMPVAVEAGKTYAWCRCGLTKTSPLCDGSHQNGSTSREPVTFVAESTTTVYLCGCTCTKDAPYCDGFTCD